MKINKKLEQLQDALWAAKVQRDIGTCNVDKMNNHIHWLRLKIQKEIKKQKEQNVDR